MLGRSAYGTMARKRRRPQIEVFQVFGIFNSNRKSDPMLSITEVTSALEAKGAFDHANLIDPASITTVALSLASMPNANEYALWLSFYAARYQVSTAALAVDVLIVLSHAAEYVGAAIAKAAGSQVKQLAAV